VADAMRVERWRRAMGASGQVQATIASAAAKVHAAVTKRREAAKIRHGDNLYKRADEEHKDALCFYFGVVEASFGRPATTTPTPVDVAAPPEPFVPTSTTCYRCNGTIWSVPCPDGKPGCEVFHHEHVCPRDEGSSNPALPPRHT
jgi:hypothetical protein